MMENNAAQIDVPGQPFMRQAGKHFTHFQTIDASNDSAIRTLTDLHFNQILPDSRAILYTDGPCEGIRTALWIVLGDPTRLAASFSDFNGLWLVELNSRKVFLHGSQHHHTEKTFGGRVVHGVDVLNTAGDWVVELSKGLAADMCKYVDGSQQDRLKATLMKMELGLLQEALRSFIRELDKQTMMILEAEGTGQIRVYNHYVSAKPDQDRNRLQAAECFPWFSRIFRNDWRLKQAIDCGRSLLSELACHFQTRPCTIRYFQEVGLPQMAADSIANLIKSLDNYTADYFPTTAEDHQAFTAVADTLDDLASTLGVDHMQLARPFINGWKSGIKQLEGGLGMQLNLELIFDMVQASFYYGVKPELQKEGVISEGLIRPPTKWFQLWFGHYGLKRLLSMAYRWERLYGRFSLNRLGMSDDTEGAKILLWSPLLTSSYRHGPYRVVELTSQHELETEGRKLQHCIASYGLKCLVSDSFIFSIRDRHGNHLSTFEIQFENGVPVLQQHKALLNEEPEPGERLIVERFIGRVLSIIPSDFIHKVHVQRNRIGLQVKGILGEPDSLEAELTEDERNQLGAMIAFTHPVAAMKNGMTEYLMSEGIAFE